jgi:hypothetical protein
MSDSTRDPEPTFRMMLQSRGPKGGRCPLWVISGNAQNVQMISGLPRQADMIVQAWQVR